MKRRAEEMTSDELVRVLDDVTDTLQRRLDNYTTMPLTDDAARDALMLVEHVNSILSRTIHGTGEVCYGDGSVRHGLCYMTGRVAQARLEALRDEVDPDMPYAA